MENYEQKYKEALGWMRSIYPTMQGADKEDAEHYFPELKESEDERIRKELIEYIKGQKITPNHSIADEWIAWLEKQGEQKPIEQDTEINDLWVYIREWNDKFGRLPKDEDELAACLDYVMKRQKPAEWSEEDERIRRCLIKDQEKALDDVRNDKYGHSEIISDLKEMYRERIDWLKSIKFQKHWKPSEQNIKDLEWCADLVKDKMGVGFHRLQVFIDELRNL